MKKGRFYTAPPLQRLDDLQGSQVLLPEPNVILEAAAFCERNPATTLGDLLAMVQEAEEGTGGSGDTATTAAEEWYAKCKEDFTMSAGTAISKKRVKLSWEEFATRDAGRAVLSFAQSLEDK